MQGKVVKFGALVQPSKSKPLAKGPDSVASSRQNEVYNLYLLRPLSQVHYNTCPRGRHDITQEYNILRSAFPTP